MQFLIWPKLFNAVIQPFDLPQTPSLSRYTQASPRQFTTIQLDTSVLIHSVSSHSRALCRSSSVWLYSIPSPSVIISELGGWRLRFYLSFSFQRQHIFREWRTTPVPSNPLSRGESRAPCTTWNCHPCSLQCTCFVVNCLLTNFILLLIAVFCPIWRSLSCKEYL